MGQEYQNEDASIIDEYNVALSTAIDNMQEFIDIAKQEPITKDLEDGSEHLVATAIDDIIGNLQRLQEALEKASKAFHKED